LSTLGWLFILSGVLIARQVSKGRVMDISTDLGDAFIAIASGDTEALGAVLARKGDATTPTAADDAIANLTEGVTGGLTTATGTVADALGQGFNQLTGIGLVAILLGSKAKGYRWGAEGPDYYDCSGLMYRAAQGAGYPGARFTTASIRGNKYFRQVSAPGTQGPSLTPGAVGAGANDIVLWPAGSGGITGHMGVMTGPDKFYSARSVKSGIGESKISTFRKTRPLYLRYTGPGPRG